MAADSGPDTVAVETADTVFMDPGDTVMMEELESSSPSGHRSGSVAHREVGACSQVFQVCERPHESSQRARAAVPRRHKSLRWGLWLRLLSWRWRVRAGAVCTQGAGGG